MSANLILDKNLYPPGVIDMPGVNGEMSPGPFYVWSSVSALHRVQARDSLPHLWPCRLGCVTRFGHWEPIESVVESSGRIKERYMPGGEVLTDTLVDDMAGGQVESILKQLGGHGEPSDDQGAVVVSCLTERLPQEIDLLKFNQIIQPFPIQRTDADIRQLAPEMYKTWLEIPKEIHDRCREVGGLQVRMDFVLAARSALKSGEITVTPLQRELYLAAIEEILPSFARGRAFALHYLQVQDQELRKQATLHQAGMKAIYDDCDLDYQWLLAHKGNEDVLARLASNMSGGLTADQLRDVLNTVVSPNEQKEMSAEAIARIVAETVVATQKQFAETMRDALAQMNRSKRSSSKNRRPSKTQGSLVEGAESESESENEEE